MTNTDMEKKRFKVTVIVYLICIAILFSLFVIVVPTMSRYTKQGSETVVASDKDFDINFTLNYNNGNDVVTLHKADLNASNGLLRLTSEEYSTITVDMNYTGEGRCYYRFKINESWQNDGAGTIIPHSLSTLTLSEDFYDGRSYDGWIYYKYPVDGESPANVKNVRAISEITIGNDAPDLLEGDYSNCVDISLEIEAVQWNRVKELWGYSNLPWEV